MNVLGNLMRHFRLVSRMARATGTDLVRASRQGDLTQEEWAGMVQTCRACEWAERCPGWLDDHPDIENAPENCLNRERFKALKAKALENDEAR